RADALRSEILELIGMDLSELVPGSEMAMKVKAVLIEKGVWSQYLEVRIGPDAEIFTKAQPMSSVGYGAEAGLHLVSSWNNPEPEVALLVTSKGAIIGATLGNDVNLRDVEGRSTLLLGKAKDNNASAALGPFVHLFDGDFTLETIKHSEIALRVEGEDGFVLEGNSSMSQISRTPESLVAATLGDHHQYPDGLVLYLGTMFAPAKNRGGGGMGFTHKLGDVVSISTSSLGALSNRVNLSTKCPPWTYGSSHLLRDLAKANLLYPLARKASKWLNCTRTSSTGNGLARTASKASIPPIPAKWSAFTPGPPWKTPSRPSLRPRRPFRHGSARAFSNAMPF
ncbi:MAG: fumarylacetoacetate hydrolase family protein, partial [Candidatus Devosia euplotis]|nr:fumarylacetoacetate hydrolase family protein [Candidatus Devosia euplotis]